MESTINDGPTRPNRGEDAAKPLGHIDQYELLRDLGGGGFGTVFLAKDRVAGIEVAVKGLPPMVRSNREELENIRSNFALVSRLHHPHIAAALVLHPANDVAYSDHGVSEKLRVFPRDYMMVMEYARGVTLSQWRRQFPGGKVPPDRMMSIVSQLADAIDYAHGERIVHRDIKPSNIMVETRSDGTTVARVLDFGLAAEIRSSMGRMSRETGDTSGTRPYMAPEQWLGKRQDAATDQYALAVLACELLCGEVPFSSVFDTGDPVLMMNVVGREKPDLSFVSNSAIRRALTVALAKSPEERFPSCGDFVAAMRGTRSAKRGRGWLLAAASVVVAVAGVGAWLWLGQTRVSSQVVRETPPVKPPEVRPATPAVQPAVPTPTKTIAVPVAKPKQVEVMPKQVETAEDIAKQRQRKAESEAQDCFFELSVLISDAHTKIARESEEVRKFFDAEIGEFERKRQAAEVANKSARYITATNLLTQARQLADNLRKQVDRYNSCWQSISAALEAQKAADAVDARLSGTNYWNAVAWLEEAKVSAGRREFEQAKADAQKATSTFRGLAAANLVPRLRLVGKRGEWNVQGKVTLVGEGGRVEQGQLPTGPITKTPGTTIPSTQVTYEAGGKRYVGTLPATKVDWKGLKTITITFVEANDFTVSSVSELKEALEKCPSGATIFLKNGVYSGFRDDITKSVNLVGESRNGVKMGSIFFRAQKCACSYKVKSITFDSGENYCIYAGGECRTSIEFVDCSITSSHYNALFAKDNLARLVLRNCKLSGESLGGAFCALKVVGSNVRSVQCYDTEFETRDQSAAWTGGGGSYFFERCKFVASTDKTLFNNDDSAVSLFNSCQFIGGKQAFSNNKVKCYNCTFSGKKSYDDNIELVSSPLTPEGGK